MNFVVEAVELWKTRRGFSKPCGKAALPKGWLSIGRQIHSWVRRGYRGRRGANPSTVSVPEASDRLLSLPSP